MRAISAAIASGDEEEDGGGAEAGGAGSACVRRAAYASEICAPSRQSPKSNARFMSAHVHARARVSVCARVCACVRGGFVRCLERL